MGLYLTRILSFFNKRDVRMLMVGLDAAGKTTLLFKLKMGETVTTIPTIGFIVESVEYKNSKLTVWDVGGQTKIRALWRHYYQNTQGIIFVIDSNDHDRIGEARHELMQMLTEEELKDSALLIYANKQDLPKAMSTSQIVDSLGLSSLRSHPWHVQATCALTGEGLYQGLDWLVSEIEKKDQLQKK